MIKSGTISVFIGMFPAMKTTEPYSPRALANASANPVSSGGSSSGPTTRKTVWSREAPRLAAASSYSRSRSSNPDDKRQSDEDESNKDAELGVGDLNTR